MTPASPPGSGEDACTAGDVCLSGSSGWATALVAIAAVGILVVAAWRNKAIITGKDPDAQLQIRGSPASYAHMQR